MATASYATIFRGFSKEYDEPPEPDKLKPNPLRETYNEMVQSLMDKNLVKELPTQVSYYKKMFDYNVTGGKMNRGTAAVHTFFELKPEEECTRQEILAAHAVGWALEVSQACFLVADDMMDRSVTRRGQDCWYRRPDVGLMAINDVIALSAAAHRLLNLYCSSHPQFLKMTDLLTEYYRLTSFGQSIDTMTSPRPGEKPVLIGNYSMEKVRLIAKYKTAYYTISHPIRFGFYLANKSDPELHKKAEELLVDMGIFFQAQDDYLDCFGDPKVTGKIGRDIEEGKCTWLIAAALEECNTNHAARKVLLEHYGVDDPESVKKVKQVYEELNIKDVYDAYEREQYRHLSVGFGDLCRAYPDIKVRIFNRYLDKLFKRIK